MPTQTKKFAADTTVTPARSREELDQLLRKYGAKGFGYVDQETAAAIIFEIDGRTYRYLSPMPNFNDFKRTSSGVALSLTNQTKAWEQAVRSQWRALVATIKGKLVAVDSGIESFEDAFQQYTVMPNGQTVKDYNKGQLETMQRTGELPRMLPSGK